MRMRWRGWRPRRRSLRGAGVEGFAGGGSGYELAWRLYMANAVFHTRGRCSTSSHVYYPEPAMIYCEHAQCIRTGI